MGGFSLAIGFHHQILWLKGREGTVLLLGSIEVNPGERSFHNHYNIIVRESLPYSRS